MRSLPTRQPLRFPLAVGQRFGHLTVVGDVAFILKGSKERPHYPCKCDCGFVFQVLSERLRSGTATMCRDCAWKKCPTNRSHGDSRTRLYKVWQRMLNRCTCPTADCYHHYGGRGITVCEQWRDFVSFKQWAVANGYEPGVAIDRIDNDGNYCPENCRWVTQERQCNNMRRNKRLTAFGETKTVADWARDPRCVIDKGTISSRLKQGWEDVEKILSTPPLIKRKRKYIKLAAMDLERDHRLHSPGDSLGI